MQKQKTQKSEILKYLKTHKKGITIADMAGKLGIHPNTYQSWEENPGRISIENGIKIAAYINVPFDDILFTPESTKLGLEE